MPEPWNPSAEPWEALREADIRAGNADKKAPEIIWSGQADALSGMGWHLSPFPPSAHTTGLLRRVEGLEAENKRLREELGHFRARVIERDGVVQAMTLAGSPGGDEQPSQCEYVEAFERARQRVESGVFDGPASVGDDSGRVSVDRDLLEAFVRCAEENRWSEFWRRRDDLARLLEEAK